MYTLEQLQSKTLGALKEIGEELNVLPPDDRRRRQSWINAIVGVNPPLLQLLEVSPAASVEQVQTPIMETVEASPVEVEEPPLESKFSRIVYPRPAEKTISQAAENSPGVDVDPVKKPFIETVEASPGVVKPIQEYPRNARRDCPRCVGIQSLYWTRNFCMEEWVIRCLYCDYERPKNPRFAHLEPPVHGPEEYPGYKEALRQASAFQAAPSPYSTVDTEPPDPNDYEFREEYDKRYKKWAAAAIPVKASPVAETEPPQEPIVLEAKTPPGVEPSIDYLDCPSCGAVRGLYATDEYFRWETRCIHCTFVKRSEHHPFEYTRPFELPLDQLKYLPVKDINSELSPEKSPSVKVEQNQGATETSPGVEVEQAENVPECSNCFGDGYVEDEFGGITFCQCESKSKLSRQKAQRAIAPAAKNLSGSRSKTSTAHQLLEFFKSSVRIIEDSPGVKTEATVSESAIVPATKNSLDAEGNQNPTLTGIFLSDRFVARYSPPQAENVRFQIDTDGQLSLLDFEVLSQPEPPDPDDFESLDGFREAIARWDWEHPNSFDQCSDLLPSSVHSEPSSVHSEPSSVHSEPSSQDNDVRSQYKPLEISIDSFCEWAQCPEDWYELHTLIEPSKVSELSPTSKISMISDFFIPTFGRWGDLNRGDEPPDTGIHAKLPKPKPPTFPLAARTQRERNASTTSQSETIPKLSRNYPETIPKLFRVVADSSTQLARSPPGGDA